ncbi:MAG: ABC transporter permease [Micropepsaceae bacterium]
MFINCVLMALRELRANLLRTGLTTLGIVIGVAAVVIVVTVTQGVSNQVISNVGALGQNIVRVAAKATRGGSERRTKSFKLADAAALEREVAGIDGVAPVTSSYLLFTAGDRNYSTEVLATTPSYLHIRQWRVVLGRAFSDGEERRGAAVCLIGDTARRELYGQQNPVGTKLRTGSFSCQVIGLLETKEHSAIMNDVNDVIMLPITTFHRRLAGHSFVDRIWVGAANARDLEGVKASITTVMRERRELKPEEPLNFEVTDAREVMTMMGSVMGMLSMGISGIAGISLIVGGIGIMNVMLVAVTERTREIGIRLAIGARGRDVLLQFLIEAVVLAIAGGILGTVIGIGSAFAITGAIGVPFAVSWWVVALAFGFSAAIGIVFGFFPALRAARLDPIEALRYE